MVAKNRQITALKRSSERREKMEKELSTEMRQRQAERIELIAAEEALSERLSELDGVIEAYRQRVTAMMTGSEAFSIDMFDLCRRYIESTESLRSDALNKLTAHQQVLANNAEQILLVRRGIAQNRGRIDICNGRVKEIENKLEAFASDQQDEETEELALARLTRK